MGEVLAKNGHQVSYLLESKYALVQAKALIPEADCWLISGFAKKQNIGQLASRFLCLEKTYGENLSFLVSQDRGLGQGYLFNAQAHPFVVKSSWNKEKKYAKIVDQFNLYETVVAKFRPDLVLGVALPNAAYLVFRKRKVPVRILTTPRFGSLYRWTENQAEESQSILTCLKKNLQKARRTKKIPATSLRQSTFASYFFGQYRFHYRTALKKVLVQFAKETYQLILGNHKRFKDGYKYLGWISPILQRPFAFKYLERHGKFPSQLKGNQIILFPLHMEPEATLFNLSPKQNNSMELIAWISKSLPANCTLLVKEHPDAFGMRPVRFYKNIQHMANVNLAHPKVPAKEWLSSCTLVANIASTMAFEAVALEKPVLSFGAHQIINLLPTVQYADSFDTTRHALKVLLEEIKNKKRSLRESRWALDMTMREVGFDLSGYEKIFKSEQLHPELANKALCGLTKEFPGLIKIS